MKPLLLLDIDGPIADWKHSYILKLNELKGTNHSVADTGNHWSIEEDLGLDPETAQEIYKHMDGPNVSANIPETPGAIHAVKQLPLFYDVMFLTAENRESPDWVHGRRQWLIRKFGLALASKIIHTHHKQLVYGDIFVDDKLENLVNWRQFWIKKGFTHHRAIRYTCGRAVHDTPKGIMEVRDWNELFPMLTLSRIVE